MSGARLGATVVGGILAAVLVGGGVTYVVAPSRIASVTRLFGAAHSNWRSGTEQGEAPSPAAGGSRGPGTGPGAVGGETAQHPRPVTSGAPPIRAPGRSRPITSGAQPPNPPRPPGGSRPPTDCTGDLVASLPDSLSGSSTIYGYTYLYYNAGRVCAQTTKTSAWSDRSSRVGAYLIQCTESRAADGGCHTVTSNSDVKDTTSRGPVVWLAAVAGGVTHCVDVFGEVFSEPNAAGSRAMTAGPATYCPTTAAGKVVFRRR